MDLIVGFVVVAVIPIYTLWSLASSELRRFFCLLWVIVVNLVLLIDPTNRKLKMMTDSTSNSSSNMV